MLVLLNYEKEGEEMITSKENTLIKHIKSLSQKKFRDNNKEYIVEGKKMVQEAIEYGEEITKIIICDELYTRNIEENTEDFIKSQKWLENQKEKIEFVSENIFNFISDTVSPQGILAILKQREVKKETKNNIIFALDDLQDPGNLGTIIRTLDAAGYQDLILSKETAEPYNPKVVRSTMGAIFRLNFYRNVNLKEELEELQKLGYKIVVTALDTDSYYYDLDFKEKLVIVIGNEARGVSEEIQEIADRKVKIPMLGKTESLNAAVATSILAYEGVRQKLNN